MRCEQAEARILDLVTARSADLPADLEAHVESCDACCVALADYRRIWEELGRISTPEPGGDLLKGPPPPLLEEARSTLRRGFPRPARLARVAAMALPLLLGGAAGYGLAQWRGVGNTAAERATATGGQTFLLLLREGEMAAPTPDEEQALVGEYTAWARDLDARGRLVAAERLADDGRLLRSTSEGPRVMPVVGGRADRVGGFFLVRAAGYDEAVRIALDSPHIGHGGEIELRRVDTAR